MDEDKLREESQPISAEDEAKILEEEQRGLKWCNKHPSGLTVWYDSRECPACQLENEQREEAAKVFLEMTKDLESTEIHNEKR